MPLESNLKLITSMPPSTPMPATTLSTVGLVKNPLVPNDQVGINLDWAFSRIRTNAIFF